MSATVDIDPEVERWLGRRMVYCDECGRVTGVTEIDEEELWRRCVESGGELVGNASGWHCVPRVIVSLEEVRSMDARERAIFDRGYRLGLEQGWSKDD